MNSFSIMKIGIFLLVSFSLFPSNVFAVQVDLTPSISVGGQYDDNIDLERDNEKPDYIITISPSFNLNIASEKNNFTIRYSPSVVRYKEEDQNNTVRHSGQLSFREELGENLTFEITDTYLRSEEPIEETEGIIGVRRTRNMYQRNTGSAGMSYTFGPENTLNFGYDHRLLENEDVTLDDGMIFDPFADLAYWFNNKSGIELSTRYTMADFTRDNNTLPGDDYSGIAAGLRYLYRFTPQTTGSIGYNMTRRDFNGPSEDYYVHEGSIGFDHAFSSRTSLAVSAGYFALKNERSENEGGYTYDLVFNKTLERGSLTISGSGGWNEAYLEAERRGQTQYQGLDSRFEYQVAESLTNYSGISYRQDKDAGDRRSKTVRVNYGWRWLFWRYFSVSLDYSCSTRDDDLDTEDYMVNRVMMNLTATRLIRW
jgi:predicted porin